MSLQGCGRWIQTLFHVKWLQRKHTGKRQKWSVSLRLRSLDTLPGGSFFTGKINRANKHEYFSSNSTSAGGTQLGSSTFHPGKSLRSGRYFPGAWRSSPALLTKKQSWQLWCQLFQEIKPSRERNQRRKGQHGPPKTHLMNFQSQTRSQKILKFSSSVAGKIHILVTKIDQGHDH